MGPHNPGQTPGLFVFLVGGHWWLELHGRACSSVARGQRTEIAWDRTTQIMCMLGRSVGDPRPGSHVPRLQAHLNHHALAPIRTTHHQPSVRLAVSRTTTHLHSLAPPRTCTHSHQTPPALNGLAKPTPPRTPTHLHPPHDGLAELGTILCPNSGGQPRTIPIHTAHLHSFAPTAPSHSRPSSPPCSCPQPFFYTSPFPTAKTLAPPKKYSTLPLGFWYTQAIQDSQVFPLIPLKEPMLIHSPSQPQCPPRQPHQLSLTAHQHCMHQLFTQALPRMASPNSAPSSCPNSGGQRASTTRTPSTTQQHHARKLPLHR